MNSIAKSVLAVLVLLASVIVMSVLRIVPVSKIWSQYSVLYVPSQTDEGEVLSCLQKNGCTNVISLSSQTVPFVSSITPVQSYGTNYITERKKYFTDETLSYSLFYIPQSQEKQLAVALKELQNERGITAGVDGSLQFPFLVPVICALVYIVLALFAKNHLVFLTAGFAPLLVTLCAPFYPAAAAVILFLTAVFLSERVWHRKGSLVAVLRCPYVDLLLLASLLVTAFLSPRVLLIFALSILASVCALFLLNQIQIYVDSRHAFNFEPIFSASQIPLMVRRRAFIVCLVSVPIAVLLLSFLLSAKFLPASSIQSVSIPTPVSDSEVGEEKDFLPDMSDYFAWAWQTITFPYKNLNKASYSAPEENESVSIPRYVETDSGVKKTYETLFTFDGSFRKELIDGIMQSEVPSVEKLLLSEGEGVHVGYRTKAQAKTSTDSVSLVLILAAMVIPLLLYLYYYLFGRRRYENGS